mmetsp:Transcript_668/g.2608  ORF Transcript_668/g.2608 Transcript_668/m.2608 type:complete len:370 (+) Transcript_668:1660-2769(+)
MRAPSRIRPLVALLRGGLLSSVGRRRRLRARRSGCHPQRVGHGSRRRRARVGSECLEAHVEVDLRAFDDAVHHADGDLGQVDLDVFEDRVQRDGNLLVGHIAQLRLARASNERCCRKLRLALLEGAAHGHPERREAVEDQSERGVVVARVDRAALAPHPQLLCHGAQSRQRRLRGIRAGAVLRLAKRREGLGLGADAKHGICDSQPRGQQRYAQEGVGRHVGAPALRRAGVLEESAQIRVEVIDAVEASLKVGAAQHKVDQPTAREGLGIDVLERHLVAADELHLRAPHRRHDAVARARARTARGLGGHLQRSQRGVLALCSCQRGEHRGHRDGRLGVGALLRPRGGQHRCRGDHRKQRGGAGGRRWRQ